MVSYSHSLGTRPYCRIFRRFITTLISLKYDTLNKFNILQKNDPPVLNLRENGLQLPLLIDATVVPMAPKARFPLPVNMGRVDGRAFPLAELTGRVTRAVNSGGGNRA